MAFAAASRYARALADVVLAPGSALKPGEAAAQLRSVADLVTNSNELATALLTPAIQISRKRAVMGRLLQELGVSSLIRNFVNVVIDHRRIGIIDEIANAFELLIDERLGFI